ncbi:C-X-C motif chemokine 13 [Epinephelus fuscoguttatus]|uniref:C-X-C motif chemokine 13 n=1 Tax=Epinephelus fuscoguttatus TaxID=293821 RepID=UPI0020D1307A|nr:C-X-C motif chemokine 13 [Epinephelus fuscoguttatus]
MCQDSASYAHFLICHFIRPDSTPLSSLSHPHWCWKIKTTAEMMTKPLLLLVALTLCCCMASLHARQAGRCQCARAISDVIPVRVIKKIEVFPITGYCRRIEVVITRKNNTRVCVDPNAEWVNNLLKRLQSKNQNTTAKPSTAASTTN